MVKESLNLQVFKVVEDEFWLISMIDQHQKRGRDGSHDQGGGSGVFDNLDLYDDVLLILSFFSS